MITFEFEHTINTRTYKSIVDVYSDKEPFEFNVSVNGSSFHILLGSHLGGNFICIPNWEIGCELASYSDTFWNSEKLDKHINPINSECLAYTIKEINKKLEME
ncbi:hypothetical protein EZV73_25100 [Acidaminobacter sp. JC074]|uniref:DUF6618 family protein n=1 Tax=Acidaminobacter sp. JC074 TaxID=2530199 RepID=UPI001F10261C|nr:DUF6618 family protein [Acidaminobacter sp. JC074]MCH4890882.1 hypothetical protein [Acidaminobacter sp. JC074]